jgi:hypothetical protein
MADETQLESSPSGEQELPTPSFSDSGVSSTSTGADEIVSKLTPVLEQIVERKLQSVKDKRISKLEEGQSSVLAVLEEMGVQIPKEVRTEFRLRELEGQKTQTSAQPAPTVDAGPSTQKAAVTEAIAKLSEYGLSSNDPAFIELLRGKYQNKDAFDKAVLSHVVTKIAPPKPANPADVVQSPARGGAQSVDAGKLSAELNQLYKNPSAPGAMQRIAEIGKQLKEAGA